MLNRRTFIEKSSLASLGLFVTPGLYGTDVTHYLSFSFDDGFKKSFYKAAEIHENYGLNACFNVIASGHLPSFKAIDDWILPELMGDFNDWNKLVSRGHEVMPHTWEHLNLTKISFSHATENIDKCLESFSDNLDGYVADNAVYNFAFNASNDELEEYLLTKLRAVRTGGWMKDTKYNKIPTSADKQSLGCWMTGPEYCDDYIEKEVKAFLENDEGGWLIFNLHGFDDEGWGPIRTEYFDKLLSSLVKLKYLEIIPVGELLNRNIG